MKTRTEKSRIFWITMHATALALWLAGCESSGYHKGQAAAGSFQRAADAVQNESRALEVTLAALSNLLTHPSPDLRADFARFSSDLDEFIGAARRSENTARLVSERSAEYFQHWDRDLMGMNYEAIRNRSQARRSEVAAQCEAVTRRYQEAQAAVQPLVQYFSDIRKALSADLTLGGLESMKESFGTLNTNAAKVQTALGKLTADLTELAARTSSIVVPSAAAAGP